MAGTARLNPRSAPILPLPNAPPREGFPYPGIPPMVAFHPAEVPAAMDHPHPHPHPHHHHRPLSQGLRGPNLKRGRASSFREDMERDRASVAAAAAMERDRVRMIMMERDHRLMMAAPRHRMMMPAPTPASGPPLPQSQQQSVFDRDPLTIADARSRGLGPTFPIDTGRGLMDGPIDIGRSRMDAALEVGRSRMDVSVDIGRSRMDAHLEAGRGRMDAHLDVVRNRMDGPPRLADEHRLRLSGPPSVGISSIGDDLPHKISGHTINMDEPLYKMINGPSSINNGYAPLHMEENASGFLGQDDEFNSDICPSLGLESLTYMTAENPILIERRLKNMAEKRPPPGIEHPAEPVTAPEDPRLLDRRLKSRERRPEVSVPIERKPETSLRAEGILGDAMSAERRSEFFMMLDKKLDPAVQDRKSESGMGTGKHLDRTITGIQRRFQNHAGAPIEGQPESISGSHRKMENPMQVDKSLEKRQDFPLAESDHGRIGPRLSHGKLPSIERGRSTDQEYEEHLEMSQDRSRTDDSHVDRVTEDTANQELVVQYKMALGELTFNSKPIITNLTIIAGENVHASRQIASTVCNHILEVPVEQKLPSLYLLDSIVKNIGSEYVKHFSERLLEVFVKSYRQMDPTLHPALQHLFKTWRGVFNTELLGEIESALNLNVISNATQSNSLVPSNTKRTDVSSPQQPGHSIHVNPRYLEVQRLKMQQVKKEGSSDEIDRLWDKDQQVGDPLRPAESGSIKHGFGSGFEVSQLSPQPLLDGYGNIRGLRVPRPSPGITTPTQGFDIRDSLTPEKECGLGNMKTQNSLSTDNSRSDKDNWFSGDGYRKAQSASRSSGLDCPILDDSVRPNNGGFSESNSTSVLGQTFLPQPSLPSGSGLVSQIHPTSLSRSSQSTPGQSVSLPALSQNSLSSPLSNRNINMGPLSPAQSGPGLKQMQGPKSPSPLSPPALNHSFSLQSKVEVTHASEIVNSQGTLNVPPMNPHQSVLKDTLHGRSRHQSGSDEKTNKPLPQLTPQLLESLQQLCHRLPSLSGGISQTGKPTSINSLPSQSTEPQQQLVVGQQKMVQEVSAHWQPSLPQTLSTSTGPAANSSPALLSIPENYGGTNSMLTTFGSSPRSAQTQPPLPSGPPPFLTAQSGPLAASTSAGLLPGIPHASPSNVQPPLPPGPPPVGSQVVVSTPPASLGPLTALGNNYTSLLSSLMAQGIITTPSSDLVLPGAPQSSFGAPTAGLLANAFTSQEQPSKSTSDNASSNPKFPIEFKQDILRGRQESVIIGLYSAFPRQCTICGLRFNQQEEHSRHMDWHVSRNRQQKSSKKVSRRWYLTVTEWSNGTEAAINEAAPAFFTEDAATKIEEEEEVVAVPADENQITCFLCGEPFEDFYSDETDEWMYKGAVYMNGTLDSTLHGPIVHAKCQSESNLTTVPNSGEDAELEDIDDSGSRRKRLRS